MTLTYANVCRMKLGTPGNGDPTVVAKLVARGSLGCIAALDQLNPRINIVGNEPWLGVQVKVEWTRLISMETTPQLNSEIIVPLHTSVVVDC